MKFYCNLAGNLYDWGGFTFEVHCFHDEFSFMIYAFLYYVLSFNFTLKNTMRVIIPTPADNGIKYNEEHHSSACPLILGPCDGEQSRQCKSCVRLYANLQRAKNAYTARVEDKPLVKLHSLSSNFRLYLTTKKKNAE